MCYVMEYYVEGVYCWVQVIVCGVQLEVVVVDGDGGVFFEVVVVVFEQFVVVVVGFG